MQRLKNAGGGGKESIRKTSNRWKEHAWRKDKRGYARREGKKQTDWIEVLGEGKRTGNKKKKERGLNRGGKKCVPMSCCRHGSGIKIRDHLRKRKKQPAAADLT